MTTRIGTAQDRHAAAEVWRASRAATGQRPSAAALAEQRTRLDDGLLVVAGEDQVVGFALGTTGEALTVELVVVHPEARGQGLGAALVEALADAAWGVGLRRAEAWAAEPGFYEACGLERSGRTEDGRVHLVAELEAPVRDVPVSGEIRLGQFLKRAELVDTGAEAKALITEGEVLVNDEVDTRRGRQLADGDVVRTPSGAARLVVLG